MDGLVRTHEVRHVNWGAEHVAGAWQVPETQRLPLQQSASALQDSLMLLHGTMHSLFEPQVLPAGHCQYVSQKVLLTDRGAAYAVAATVDRTLGGTFASHVSAGGLWSGALVSGQ